jgi:LacI family transcriptional regulator
LGNQRDATVKVARKRREQGAPTIASVARQAGVSIATVSRVVNDVPNKVSAATIAKVKEAIAAQNYRPLRAGIALRTRKARMVALMISSSANSFYGAITALLEPAFARDGLTTLLCHTDDDPDRQDACLAEMQSHMVSGIVLVGAVASPGLRRAVGAGAPVVFVNRPPPRGIRGPYVGADHQAAGRDVANHFLAEGYARPATIHGIAAARAGQARQEGFLARMAAAGRALPPDRILTSGPGIRGNYQVMRGLLAAAEGRADRLPDAVFCTSDLVAYGVYRACLEAGLAVPGDIALFGFDDNPINPWIARWLGTVQVSLEGYGEAVHDVLSTLWAGVRPERAPSIILPHRLVLRWGPASE